MQSANANFRGFVVIEKSKLTGSLLLEKFEEKQFQNHFKAIVHVIFDFFENYLQNYIKIIGYKFILSFKSFIVVNTFVK